VLRTVHPTDFYYAKSGWSCREAELWSYGNAELWSYGNLEFWSYGNVEFRSYRSGLVVRRVKETMWLQLMCCALSNFSLSQFTRGQTGSYGIERKM